MSKKFVWRDVYNIGNRKIDEDHKHLFELGAMIAGSADESSARRVMTELKGFIESHFRAEELIMRECKYPEYQRHVSLHRKIIEQLNGIMLYSLGLDQAYDNAAFVRKVSSLIEHLLFDHFVHEDFKLRPYVDRF